MQTDSLEKLYARPGMYLAPYGEIDAASFISNFLFAVFDSAEQSIPNIVTINVAGEHFFIKAEAFTFVDNYNDYNNLADLFNVANYQKPCTNHSLTYLQPIVWFAEHCLIDISTEQELTRHFFLHGTPQTKQTKYFSQQKNQYVSFMFTLPQSRFKNIELDINRLKYVIDEWEKRLFVTTTITLTLKKQWCEQYPYHYNLQITPEL